MTNLLTTFLIFRPGVTREKVIETYNRLVEEGLVVEGGLGAFGVVSVESGLLRLETTLKEPISQVTFNVPLGDKK